MCMSGSVARGLRATSNHDQEPRRHSNEAQSSPLAAVLAAAAFALAGTRRRRGAGAGGAVHAVEPRPAGQRHPDQVHPQRLRLHRRATPRRRWSGATFRRGRSRWRCRCTIPMRRPAAASGIGPSTTCRRARRWRRARATRRRSLPAGAYGGNTDFVDTGATGGNGNYGGPCPPQGDRPHRYVFTLYALGGRQGRGRRRHSEDRHGGALQLRDEQGRRPGAARQGVVHRDLRKVAAEPLRALMPGYATKQERIAIAGAADLMIRSLLDRQQFSDPLRRRRAARHLVGDLAVVRPALALGAASRRADGGAAGARRRAHSRDRLRPGAGEPGRPSPRRRRDGERLPSARRRASSPRTCA